MTAKELIELLKLLPEETRVMVVDNGRVADIEDLTAMHSNIKVSPGWQSIPTFENRVYIQGKTRERIV